MTLPLPTKRDGAWFVCDGASGSVKVQKRVGGFYGLADKFDFWRATEDEIRGALEAWGYTTFVGVER